MNQRIPPLPMNPEGPKVGSVVTIGKSRSHLLVIESGRTSSKDELRGDYYYGWEVKTIPMTAVGTTAPWQGPTINPKVTTWTLDRWSMGGKNMIEVEAIKVVDVIKFEKREEVTYVKSVPKAKRKVTKTPAKSPIRRRAA